MEKEIRQQLLTYTHTHASIHAPRTAIRKQIMTVLCSLADSHGNSSPVVKASLPFFPKPTLAPNNYTEKFQLLS